MQSYKESKTGSPDPADVSNKRRIENYSWRIMNSAAQSGTQSGQSSPMVGSDLWRASQGFSTMDSAAAAATSAHQNGSPNGHENGNG
jgi:hypothetical protein